MTRLLLPVVAFVAAAALARWAVYGSGPIPSASALRGYVLLSAFAGGVALAFSRPFLLVSLPYIAVLFGDRGREGLSASRRWAEWVPGACYLAAFALAFTVTISGFPNAIATPIHASEWLIDSAGGAGFLAWGLFAFFDLVPAGPTPSIWTRLVSPGSAVVLGAAGGALMYHELDPTYDSVFFFTANPVAASHAPVTVAVFATGLGLTYLAGGRLVTALASRSRRAHVIVLGGRALAGVATALIGLAILTSRFDTIRRVLF